MACTNSPAHRFLLPSVVPKLGIQQPMAFQSWVDTTMQPEVAPLPLKGSVCVLGKRYMLPQDQDEMDCDIYSKFWFTYRRGFRQIGDSSIRTDTGWGCTLRCGQMMLAYSLVLRHLGREWRYDPNNRSENYNKILEMFHDNRNSEYSIQMIALQGADLGRTVGQWFGPNNVAHSIKRLCQYDQWSKLAVYVALDMLVIIDDMKLMCRKAHGIHNNITVQVTKENGEKVHTPGRTANNKSSSNTFSFSKSDPSLSKSQHQSTATATKTVPKPVSLSKRQQPKMSLSFSPTSIPNNMSRSYDPNADSALLNLTMEDFQRQFSGDLHLTKHEEEEENASESEEDVDSGSRSPEDIFRPLLLFIPLRLGQEKFNMEYAEALKACFSLPQSVGVIGGKPRHALWFIGYHNNNLLYFDPHTTQSYACMTEEGLVPDDTYHLRQADRIPISDLDPSLALGFFCKDEKDMDDMCIRLRSDVLSKMSYMFELTQTRPPYWGPPDSTKHTVKEPFILLEPDSVESEEGFELVEWPYPAPTPEKGEWPRSP